MVDRSAFPRTMAAVNALVEAVEQEVYSDSHAVALPGRPWRLVTLPKLRRRNPYLAKRLHESLDKQRKTAEARQLHGLGAYWLVPAGLSDPGLSVRSVADWCRDFNADVPPLALASVTRCRDASCETLKDMARRRLH